MPHHAHASVARPAAGFAAGLIMPADILDAIGVRELRGAQSFRDGDLYCVELVIASHLLDEPAAAVVLEHDEAYKVFVG
jgi:hypothetical protein